jgi:hypothetical protein
MHPLLIKMIRFREKADILGKWKLLKGTGISSEDCSPDERKARAILNKKRKEILDADNTASCKIRNGNMTVTVNGREEHYKVNENTWILEKKTRNQQSKPMDI